MVFTLNFELLTNQFSFAFPGKAKGEYFIRAGKAEKRIRNLPYRKGEVRIDSQKVIHRDGKKIFPYGWFSETFGRMYPGVNVADGLMTADFAPIESETVTVHVKGTSGTSGVGPLEMCNF